MTSGMMQVCFQKQLFLGHPNPDTHFCRMIIIIHPKSMINSDLWNKIIWDNQLWNLDVQIQKLKNAGCDEIFMKKISGVKEERKELNRVMDKLRKWDSICVVRLDRLGRRMIHLIQMINDFKEKGRIGGRARALTLEKEKILRNLCKSDDMSVMPLESQDQFIIERE